MEYMKTQRPYDPREDLIEDSELWVALLSRLWDMKKNVYGVFHALRCGSSHLALVDNKIKFTFGEDFNGDFLKKIKEKYLDPNKDFIQVVMNILAKDMQNGSETMFKECPF